MCNRASSLSGISLVNSQAISVVKTEHCMIFLEDIINIFASKWSKYKIYRRIFLAH